MSDAVHERGGHPFSQLMHAGMNTQHHRTPVAPSAIRRARTCTLDEGSTKDVHAQFLHLVAELAPLDLAYLHVFHSGDDDLFRSIRELWPNSLLVLRFGREREQIADDVVAGLANPDIVERLRRDAPLNDADPTTF